MRRGGRKKNKKIAYSFVMEDIHYYDSDLSSVLQDAIKDGGEIYVDDYNQDFIDDAIQELYLYLAERFHDQAIDELEDEPAYIRRNININDDTYSSKSKVSRYSLGDEEDNDDEKKKKSILRDDNSYLHDNVD